jgi:hypothetical protein
MTSESPTCLSPLTDSRTKIPSRFPTQTPPPTVQNTPLINPTLQYHGYSLRNAFSLHPLQNNPTMSTFLILNLHFSPPVISLTAPSTEMPSKTETPTEMSTHSLLDSIYR